MIHPGLIPVWVAGLDHHLLLVAALGAAGSQMLNNIIGARISGTNYTENPLKIRGGVVASVIATILIFLIIIIAYHARGWLRLYGVTDDSTHAVTDTGAGLFRVSTG